MHSTLSNNLLFLFLLLELTAWTGMFLLLNNIITKQTATSALDDFWEQSNLLHLFLLLTTTFSQNYQSVFIEKVKVRRTVYGIGSLTLVVIAILGLMSMLDNYIESGDQVTLLNCVVLLCLIFLSLFSAWKFSQRI